MGHSHSHGHSHEHDSSGDIRFAFFLNLGFAVVELFGGLYTNSLAILSDALHDLGDSLILGLSWFLERYSKKERTDRFSYGFKRFSLLGALLNAAILITGSVFIIFAAIPRIMDPVAPDAEGMMYFAIVGVIVNGIAVLRLRRGRSMNARVVAWHMIEDVLGWLAVLIVSIVMQLTYLPVLDPILSLLIASYILYYNVIVNFNKTLQLFLQAVPDDLDMNRMQQLVVDIENVQSMHHVHAWSLDGMHHVLSAHVVISADTGKDETIAIKKQIKSIMLGSEIEHITLEIEFEDEDCIMGPEWNADRSEGDAHGSEGDAHGSEEEVTR